MGQGITAAAIGRLAARVREEAPLVQNLTNLVVQKDSAAAIAAVGATQLTLHGIEEAGAVAELARALAVNAGTLDDAWLRAVHVALGVAARRRRPWILDPVGVALTGYRQRAVQDLLAQRPTVLKGNASEILALAGLPAAARGADSGDSVGAATDAAVALARQLQAIVVVTGAGDLVTDGERRCEIRNGTPLMGRMIGSGCLLTAVIACFLAVTETPFEAAVAAVAWFDVAGEIATAQAGGPGTLLPLLLDGLDALTPAILDARMRIVPG